jgi:hypothetical protein
MLLITMFVELRVVAGNIRTASSAVQQIVFFVVCRHHSLQSYVWIVVRRVGMLLIIMFVELRVVTGNIRTASSAVQQIVFFVVRCYHSLQS